MKLLIKNIVIDCVVFWLGFYALITGHPAATYWLNLWPWIIGFVVVITALFLISGKEAAAKSFIKGGISPTPPRSEKLRRSYVIWSTSIEILMFAALGFYWLAALYALSTLLVLSHLEEARKEARRRVIA